jgi:hypothetical protein
MPVTVAVEDPDRIIKTVELMAESDDAITLRITSIVKHIDPGPFLGCQIHLNEARVAVSRTPFADDNDGVVTFAQVWGYECYWTLLCSKRGDGTLYTQENHR